MSRTYNLTFPHFYFNIKDDFAKSAISILIMACVPKSEKSNHNLYHPLEVISRVKKETLWRPPTKFNLILEISFDSLNNYPYFNISD